jgi:hypothetical protein
MAARIACARWSEIVYFAIPKHGGWLFFKACVTLKRILAARKRPVVRRLRKAALVSAIWFAGSGALTGEEILTPTTDQIRSIGEIGTSIAPPTGELPPNVAQVEFARAPVVLPDSLEGRDWLSYAYFWEAPALCHRPLYFEEPNLERYGHHACCMLQPLMSGVHFFSAVPALPFKMALERPHRYNFGYARPGSDPCWQRPW